MRFLCTLALIAAGLPAFAQTDEVTAVVDGHILPGYRALAEAGAALSAAAEDDCAAESAALRDAYGDAFDAWIRVSHLRFGPSETGDRAFALAFWPDSRGVTPKTLATLIRDADPVTAHLESFQTVSIAARGFYAMEFLLYDPAFTGAGEAAYRCGLIRVMAADIANLTAVVLADWDSDYADRLRQPGSSDTYRSPEEAAQQLFTSLATGLEFTSDVRLGRPLGTWDRPRPLRAEARRSGRSLRHVALSLEGMREMAGLLSQGDAEVDAAFARALEQASALDDPDFSGVADPQGRFRVEVLQQRIDEIRDAVAADIGPRFGIAEGFNSMDGD